MLWTGPKMIRIERHNPSES